MNVTRNQPLDKSFSTSLGTRPREPLSTLELYFKEIRKFSLLTPSLEMELALRVRRGDERAREKLINANLRLVVKIAKDFEGHGVPLLDLINEGNLGLMRAVERFDPNRGAKFSTYSSYWIKQAIKRCLSDNSKTIRVPAYMLEKQFKLRRVERGLAEELGREPTHAELARELETSVADVRSILMANQQLISLDQPLEPDSPDCYQEKVADEKAETPYAVLERQTSNTFLLQLLKQLDDREVVILKRRFGLDDHKRETLDAIGSRLGVTRERIRQLQNEALVKLRRMMENEIEHFTPEKINGSDPSVEARNQGVFTAPACPSSGYENFSGNPLKKARRFHLKTPRWG